MGSKKQMVYLGSNLKFLRTRKKKTQDFIASTLGFTRTKWTAYETGQAKNPQMDDLITISDYFKFSIDLLLRENLSAYSELKLFEIENSFDYAKGNNLRIVAISVDKDQKENIEYVGATVKAGYMVGYNDPDFIKELPKVALPFITRGKTMRMFDSEGDSMLPLPEKCKILGEYIDDWFDVKDGDIYIVISHTQGYAIKKVYKQLNMNSLTLKSLNSIYPEYEIYLSEVNELWKFKGYYSESLPTVDNFISYREMLVKIDELREMVEKVNR
jgi:transcriptional regulator with XRE-family HTH domain